MSSAEAIKEMMDAWNRIVEAARQQFPAATEDQLYDITKGVMDRSIQEAARV